MGRNQYTGIGLLFGLVLILGWIHFRFFHGGYLGYDELEYARLALFFEQGKLDHDSLYAFRYFGYVPLALLYAVFGANDFSNWLMTMIYLAITIGLTLSIWKSKSFLDHVLIAALIFFSPLHLLYLEKPMPDIITELGMFMCLASLFWQNTQTQSRAILVVPLFLLGACMVFLSKETFLIIYPVFVFFLIKDLTHHENYRFWKNILLGGIVFLFLYFLLNQVLLGHFLARVNAIFSNRYISSCSYEWQPAMVILKRIAYELWLNLIRMGMLIPLGFALIMLRRVYTEKNQRSIFWVWNWLFLLILSNFMTISYTDYVPLCPDPRHFMFLIPIGTLIVLQGFKGLKDWTLPEFIFLEASFLVQGILSYTLHFENHWALYIALMVGVWLTWKYGFDRSGKAVFIAGLFSIFIQNSGYNLTLQHRLQKDLIEAVINHDTRPKYIVTDGANANIGNFYSGYNEQVKFISFQEYKPDLEKQRETFIVMNGLTAYLANTDWQKVSPEIIKITETKAVFYENAAGKVYEWK